MRLLIIRHAEAEDQVEFARRCPDDGLRPLTKKGRRRMARTAKGLAEVVGGLDVIASSPLVRAAQTAEIVADQFDVKPAEIGELVPARAPAALLKWLRRHRDDSTVAVVGHEPHLGRLVSWLMSGLDDSMINLGKGAAVLLDFDGEIGPGKAKLKWAMTGKQLRRL